MLDGPAAAQPPITPCTDVGGGISPNGYADRRAASFHAEQDNDKVIW